MPSGSRGAELRATAAALAVAGAGIAAGPAQAAEQQAYAAGLTYATPAIVAGKGDTLRFTNLDAAAAHDVDSDQAGLFQSPLVVAGESTKVDGVDLLNPGTYAFHCSIHSWMKGALTIGAAGAGGGPTVEPGAPGSGDPPDPAALLPKAAAQYLSGGEWPFYGRDLSNTRDGGAAGPSYNQVPNLGPVWSRLSKDGDFTGTPVVARGLVIAGSRGGTVFAVDADSGKVRWTRDLLDDAAEREDALINASAAIVGGRVYVPVVKVGSPRVVALSLATGRQLWSQVIDTQRRSDTYGSPTVWNGSVFMGTSGYFGEQLSGNEVSARGSVVALDARTGRLRWKTYTTAPGQDGAAVWSTPAVDPGRGLVYVGTGNAYHAPAGDMTDSMLSLDAATGRVVGHFQATAGDVWNGAEDSLQSPDADFGASPNLFRASDGRDLVGQGQKNGLYWALDRVTMQPVWNVLTGPGSFMGGIVGSTALDGDRIYGPNTQGGAVWAIGRDGRHNWVSSDGGPLHFAPVSTANGVVYSNDFTGFLTARDARTGLVLNRIPLGAGSWGGISIAGGSVFTVTGTSGASGYIVAYRPRELASSPGPATAPRLRLTGARRQRAARRGFILVHATCNERCSLSASGRARAARRRVRLRRRTTSARAEQRRRLALRIAPRGRHRLRRALRRKRSVPALVEVTARDTDGNTTIARRRVKVIR